MILKVFIAFHAECKFKEGQSIEKVDRRDDFFKFISQLWLYFILHKFH